MESKDPLILPLVCRARGAESVGPATDDYGPELVAHLEDPEHRLGYCRILIRVGGFVE